jgi:hypothetical protein
MGRGVEGYRWVHARHGSPTEKGFIRVAVGSRYVMKEIRMSIGQINDDKTACMAAMGNQ